VAEACSTIGEKGACNDHSPRDITVAISMMSDLEFGQTGFRFARIEALEEGQIDLISIYGSCLTPDFPNEASIRTNDERLNRIIDTAAYTLKLCFQNGYIWDGVKRDRLVWCGDLHPEIMTSLYWFGNTPNVKNSLEFLRENTPKGTWVNTIPTYSAWWVINACDYVDVTGDEAFFAGCEEDVLDILKAFNSCVAEDGTMSVVDWAHVAQGNASADAAMTYLLFTLKNAKIADLYMKLFCKKSDIARQYVQQWLPIVAAAQLEKDNELNKEFLMSWIDVMDFQ
jgi:hypothetical protein